MENCFMLDTDCLIQCLFIQMPGKIFHYTKPRQNLNIPSGLELEIKYLP